MYYILDLFRTTTANMQLLLLEYAHCSHEMGLNVLIAALAAAAYNSSSSDNNTDGDGVDSNIMMMAMRMDGVGSKSNLILHAREDILDNYNESSILLLILELDIITSFTASYTKN